MVKKTYSPIKKPRVRKLRKKMLEYDKFSEQYEEFVCTAPLEDLVGLVRTEMYTMHKEYSKGERKDAGFFENYIKVRGVHELALNLAFDAKLIDNTHRKFTCDLHNFAEWGSQKPVSPKAP